VVLRCVICGLHDVPPPPTFFVQGLRNIGFKSGPRFGKSGLKCETPAVAGVSFTTSIV
jgi:hypothetical protein